MKTHVITDVRKAIIILGLCFFALGILKVRQLLKTTGITKNVLFAVKRLTVRVLSNEVVIGLMSVTLIRK